MSKKRPNKAVSQPSENSISAVKSQDKSPFIYQRDKISFPLSIRERDDLTEKQKQLIDLIMDKKSQIIFVNGPAGTSKTFCAIQCALKLLEKGAVSDIIYVRSIAESASKSFGTLPGEIGPKLQPFLMPLMDKLNEFLPKNQIDRLIKEERVTGIPINFLRGASINAKVIIGDETQNLDFKELTTLITRLGKFSKMILVGDSGQSDINGKSGFMKFFNMFNDEESRNKGIHCFSFTKEDIIRSGILGYIVEKIEGQQSQSGH